MTKQAFFFFLLFSIINSYNMNAQDLHTFDLNGNWKFRRAGTKDWFPAKVPGTVHQDLLRNKLIPDPYDQDHEAKLQWIGETGWEYSKTFNYAEEKFAWRHIELVCKGLDTYANVYVNDSLILVANNMFREWFVDIKQYLHIGPNTLRIQFPAVMPQIKGEYDKLLYKLPGDEKVICRKAAFHFGWDWGPTYITSGIWRSIYIREWQSVNLLGVQFIQKQLTDSMATVAAQVTMFANLDDSAQIRLFIDSAEVYRQSVSLVQGPNVVRGDVFILKPERWWPNGLGAQKLYNFGYEVYFNGEIIGRGSQKIGLRTIELVQEKDSIGKSFYFKVNGQPVFVKGANYIPQDNFQPRVKDSTYRALLWDVKKANMNMLRVWGGGIYENDIFYDLCDELGIMVWQDFMFACGMYPGSKDFLDNVRSEAIQNIVRLRRHPSLALWCGNNEIDEGWKNWGWQKQYGYSPEDSTNIYRDYKTLFNSLLPGFVKRFDTARAYIHSSPLYGWGRKESMSDGDSHYWGVWWGKEPLTAYTKKVGRFMSEFGFQAFPDLSTINKFTKPEDRNLGSPVMKAHQKHPVGYETIDEHLLRDYRKPKDFSSYVYVSQLLQSEGIVGAIEAHRRAKPRCMGTMFWQLNDCWPVVSWSARDCFGKKKALFYALPAAYNQLLVSPVIEDGRVKIYISSDDPLPQTGVVSVNLTDFNGVVKMDKHFTVEVPGNSSLICFDTVQSNLLDKVNPAEVLLRVTYTNSQTGSETKHILYFVPPKDLNLPVPLISKTIKPSPKGYTIRLSSDKLVKNLFLSSSVAGDFSDNYFDLIPGETVEVEFMTRKKDANISEKIMVKSLVDSY